MHGTDLILTMAIGLSTALILGYITQRLGLSPIVGYLLAGVAVGPHTPGVLADSAIAEQLAEVGVILLMFGVGLQFHHEELLAVRRVAIPGAAAGMTGAALLGAVFGHAAGWPWTASVVFGLTLSVASTVVLVRVLSDRRQLHTSIGHIAVGWLVAEDVLTVVVLVLLPTLASGNLTSASLATGIGLTILKIVGLVALAGIVGQRLIPAVLDRVAATRSRELFTLTVLAIALGIAAGSAMVFGVSMALGAFVAGMVVNRSDYSLRAATDALPMRDAFAVLFFVSVGMLLDPLALLNDPALALGALLVVVVVKPLIAGAVLGLSGYPLRTAVAVPAALAQIGEFSFILAAAGRELNILPEAATNIIVAVSITSIVVNPPLSRLIAPVEQWLARRRASRTSEGDLLDQGARSTLDPQARAIVVGFGPTGRTVTRLLQENQIAPTVVDLNVESIRQLREQGISAIHGDARYPETLVSAGLRHAGTLIVSGADTGTPDVIARARDLNPDVHIFVRGTYLRDVAPLRAAGAEQVFSGEGEVALAMTEAVLRRLGATPDQIDRERARVREELFITAGAAGSGAPGQQEEAVQSALVNR